MSTAAELDLLLSESPEAANTRAQSALDVARQGLGDRIVIYGAGNLGRRVLAMARNSGLEVVAFADANSARWGELCEGVPLLSPEQAARRYASEALFVVAVWHPALTGGMRDILSMLHGLGCRTAPFVFLFWKNSVSHLLFDLPGKLLAQSDAVRRAFQLLDEDAGFVRQVKFRLYADFDAQAAPANEPQYFPDRLFSHDPDECFVDCGAFDGDSLSDFYQWSEGRFRSAIAFEAEPVNFSRLQQFAASGPHPAKTRLIQAAVSDSIGKLRFSGSGLASAAASADGEIEVDCVTMDHALESDRPTFIKMDIEGAEIAALQGAAGIISRHQPVLAICVYHQIDHLWNVPLLAGRLLGPAKLILRPYRVDGFDTVCYAIPAHRSVR